MFAVPINPPPKPLKSIQFVKDVKGKIRCLKSLMTNKRAQVPEHMALLTDLICFFQTMVECAHFPATTENLKRFKYGEQVCKMLEMVVIRVIQGESPEEAWKVVKETASNETQSSYC
ncbi:hypothetical protein GCK72_026075 [Caenorhabditis remanei]|nr:hypothetical protein GCK72_026075 [Caenorhabditis remanei]KAF1749607.1 hypothetical protein GCK72_026075 [Caenorhabditis remanei]